MKQFLARIICCFIPSRKLRHKIRNAAKSQKYREVEVLAELSNKLDRCIEDIQRLQQIVKVSHPVEELKPASGNMGLIQKASVSILAHFAKVAKKHNLKYWLDSGTLIGYLRHNGNCVPWDDDIDICMERSDYVKLQKALDKDFCKNGFFYQMGEITRLYYKNLHVWVDIFPMDTGDTEIPPTGEAYNNFIAILNNIKSAIDFDHNKWLKHEKPVSQKYLDTCYYRRDKELVKKKHKNGFIFYGVETAVRTRVLYNHATVFPLKPVKFFGIDAYIPQSADSYLFQMYGDYMNWPQNFQSYHGNSLADNLDYNSYLECHELIKGYYPTNKKAKL